MCSEPSTLESILDDLLQHPRQLRLVKPTVVVDAGIGTEANLQMIRTKGLDYVCVDRRRFQELPEGDSTVVHQGPSGLVKAIRSADASEFLCSVRVRKDTKRRSPSRIDSRCALSRISKDWPILSKRKEGSRDTKRSWNTLAFSRKGTILSPDCMRSALS